MNEKKTVMIIGKDVPLDGKSPEIHRKIRPLFALLSAAVLLAAVVFGIIAIHKEDKKALSNSSKNQSSSVTVSAQGEPDGTEAFELKNVDGKTVITEKDIVSAEQMTYKENYGVLITFGERGKQKFSEITAAAASASKNLEVYLDGKILVSADVPAAITGGEAVLYFQSPEAAENLCNRINGLLQKQ